MHWQRAGESCRRALHLLFETMNPSAPVEQLPIQAPKPPSFWRKLGGGSLSVSIIVHAIILGLGVFWIFRIIPQKEQQVDFMPKGGGGGQVGAKSETNMKKRATMTTMNAPKLAAKGVTSTFTLPEPDPASAMSSVGALGSSGMAAGLGGSGSGGGKGNGKGKGFGDGMGPGMGGRGGAMNPFGMLNPTSNHLLGHIYDFYHYSDGKTSKHPQNGTGPGTNNLPWLTPLVTSFIEGGWREERMKPYYQGPATLGISQLLIPVSPDTAAPDAFQATGKMTGGAWVAIYRGAVTAPETAEIRFLGTADNYLAVRFNNRNVVTFGCGNKPSETKNVSLRMPLAVGQWVRVTKDSTYDVDILIGDAGGLFSACLCYEKKDDPGKLFLFRTEASDFAPVLAKDKNDVPKNLEKDSPVWPCKPAGIRF